MILLWQEVLINMITDDVARAFPDLPIADVGSYYSQKIYKWKHIFENEPDWRKAKKSGLHSRGDRNMQMLNAAKVLCDTFADLTFSEQVNITINNDEYQKYIDNQLNLNGFWKHMPELISNAYAIGGCAIKVYADNGNPKIDYIHACNFLPVSWNGKEIKSGAFVSEIKNGKNYYHLIEFQKSGSSQYKLFKSPSASDIGAECNLSELYPQIKNNIDYNGANIPMFAYFKPSVSNNYEYNTPLGMSIYANAIDTLKALDIAFDSFSREFILGKKRIIVPAQAVQTIVDPNTGNMVRYFDADDEAFIALKTEDNASLQITDNTINLRVTEHVAAINALLNILCFQVGLSAGTLSFDSVQGMKTATEIISQDSKTARTIKSNKNLLTETIESIVHSLITLGTSIGIISNQIYTVTVGWQDNIVIDDNTLIDNNIKLVQAGLKSKLSAIMDVLKCDEKTALKEIEQINKDQSVSGLTVDDFLNGGDDNDEDGTDAAQSRNE